MLNCTQLAYKPFKSKLIYIKMTLVCVAKDMKVLYMLGKWRHAWDKLGGTEKLDISKCAELVTKPLESLES